ncbi:MAG: nuclear transport factor 2 family protein [Rhizobiales bacterium]|nr:nuclear transport factor 2 family protein [Hyphomicrobiales bacterium]
MNRRTALLLSAISAALLPVNAFAQQADVDGVKAASRAYYAALAVADNGAAMEKVWAHTPYVTYVGPRSKSIIVGWEPLKKMWEELNNITAERKVAVSDAHIHVNGNLAWEMAQESGSAKFKDGNEVKIDSLVTNVYEKLDGRWLMVSHHVQPKPQ